MRKKLTVVTDDGGEQDLVLPIKYVVCYRCDGRGVHDCWEGGVTADQEVDPDFWDDYRSGMYDKRCDECNGLRVVEEVDRDACSPEDLRLYDSHMEAEWQIQAAYEAERRMGC